MVLREWVSWMQAQDYSASTVEDYLYCVHVFLSRPWMAGRDLLSDVSPTEVVTHLAAFGSRSGSKAQHRKALRCLYRWATRRGYLPRGDDPTDILDRPKPPRRSEPEPYSPEELTRLCIAAAWRSERRAWAILACFALGTRRGEFVALRPDDIDWEHRKVWLRHTKGDRPRYVDLSPLAAEALRELLRHPGQDGTVLGIRPQTFTQWVNEAARDAGFPPGRKRRAHTLRSSYATALEEAGVRPSVIQHELGHVSLATTTAYLGRRDGEGARAVAALDLDWGAPRGRGWTRGRAASSPEPPTRD